MAAKVFVEIDADDLASLSKELERLSQVCGVCSDVLKKSGKPLKTAGLKHAIDGLEALANVCAGVIGPYQSEAPDLREIREKIKDVRGAPQEAAKQLKAMADAVDKKKPKKKDQV